MFKVGAFRMRPMSVNRYTATFAESIYQFPLKKF
jgi:hypothetical protein